MIDVTTDFPGGNVCVLDVLPDMSVPEIHFTSSPAGGPEAMWFFFRIDPGLNLPSKSILCVLHFIDNLLGGNPEKFIPVFKTETGCWTRVETVESVETADGRPLVSWKVPGNEGHVSVALCYPYGPNELSELEESVANVFGRDYIGASPNNNLVARLSNAAGITGGSNAGIYLTARQHSGETPGSYLLDGFIRRVAEAGGEAPVIWAVPFVNIDGVIYGHFGKDSFPCDFNRSWGSKLFSKELIHGLGSHPMRHEVKCIQNDMLRWSKRCRPALVLDFHAPTMAQSDGIFVYLRDADREDCNEWALVFQKALGEKFASERFVRDGDYHSRWNTARSGDYTQNALNVPHISIETPYAMAGGLIFTIEDYRKAGGMIADAVLEKIS